MRGAIRILSGAILVTALVGGCNEDGKRSTQVRNALTTPAGLVIDTSGAQCLPVAAHEKHEAVGFPCAVCHACGGAYEFGTATFPRGTTTAGGTLSRSASTTCLVGCHYPIGGTPRDVAWNTPGPLGCSDCHDQGKVREGATVTSHPVDFSSNLANRAACQNCHVVTSHTSGSVLVAIGDGQVANVGVGDLVNPACITCHYGNGQAVAGQVATVIPDFSSATGDFHGARAGTGWGGTLLPPYTRGQGPLTCVACHESHASGNLYMFASAANDHPVAPGITRQGVGAESLCAGCHSGERHAGCERSGCHDGVDPMPAGSPCFFCHGHEGIVNFPRPEVIGTHPFPSGDCTHCHSAWRPTLETTPPVISGVTISGVRGDQATVSWTTNENATSYVEFGAGVPSRTAGNYALATSHQVVLTGLAGGTTYVFRTRSADAMRNVALSGLGSFTTGLAGAPPPPTLVHQTDQFVPDGSPPVTRTLAWSAVAAPAGNPVQYRVVVSYSPSFAGTMADSGWISATSYAVTFPQSYCDWGNDRKYWRVMARDAVTTVASPWSDVDTFWLCAWSPYE